jgi:RNA polymerase sigma-70 factor (ECF subfamily)
VGSSVSTATETTLGGRDLAARLLNQDPAALEEVISRYQAKIFNTAYTIVKNHQDAQEITQDTLFAIYRKIGTFRGDSSLCTWICRITLNNTFMKLRRRRKEPHIPIDEMQSQDGKEPFRATILADQDRLADEWIVRREIMEKVRHAMEGLPDKYRQILHLEILHDYSNAEIRQRLNLSMGAVKSRLHRARVLLHGEMKHFVGSSN